LDQAIFTQILDPAGNLFVTWIVALIPVIVLLGLLAVFRVSAWLAVLIGSIVTCSDPIGGDGIICDAATGETWPTEHVMVPRLRAGQTDDAETLILKAIDQKRDKGGAAYAAGKTLIVFLDAGADTWFPNRVARRLPRSLAFRGRVGRGPARG